MILIVTAFPVMAAEGGPAGLDSLLSTVQMPPGVPVATMGVGKAGGKNAAVLAVQILALADPALRQKLAEFRQRQEEAVRAKDASVSQ